MNCPLCGGRSEPAFTTTDRNRARSDERFLYRRCLACGTYFLTNVPADLEHYYGNDYYQLPEPADLDRLATVEGPKLSLITEYISNGRLVEIGPGPGTFARAARNAGFDVTAIEMDARCCDYLERAVGVTAIKSARPEEALAEGPPARAIAMWHVLEHLDRPYAVIDAAALTLEPGGVLAVAVPNPQSTQFRLLRGRWAHVDAPRHLFLIPYGALHTRLTTLGLKVLRVTSSDAAGRQWNRFGWEYAIRRFPARRSATLPISVGASLLAQVLAPVERRGLAGATYTVIAAKPDR
jgi:2-polyprenyl-3-methyl-5-hydroxy-6-metoxy-1,4-benzoquinol methylase